MRRGALAALVLAAALAVPASTSAKDVTKLFDKAVGKVTSKPDFADAVVLEADGAPNGRKAADGAAQINKWLFVFQNATEGSDFASVTIRWRRGEGFGKPKGHRSPFLEDVVIKKAPKMSLNDALDLMDDAGYGRSFFNVVLRSPLGPERVPPLYIFEVAQGTFVSVNTKTGDVEPID